MNRTIVEEKTDIIDQYTNFGQRQGQTREIIEKQPEGNNEERGKEKTVSKKVKKCRGNTSRKTPKKFIGKYNLVQGKRQR